MSTVDFEFQKITTITAICDMKGDIDQETFFNLLPITKIETSPDNEKSKAKKYKFKTLGKPGTILSARYNERYRGIVRSVNTKAFKNSITFDISTEKKVVNIKLSRKTVHLTGVKSVGNGQEAIRYIVKHVYTIDDLLKRMNAYRNLRDRTIEWVRQNTKGENMLIKNSKSVYEIFTKTQFPLITIPEDVDLQYAMFLLEFIDEYENHNIYSMFLEYVKRCEKCINEGPYDIDKFRIGTMNINYYLGFFVNRRVLNKLIQNKKPEYTSRFYNVIENKVTINKICPELPPSGSKKKRPRHSLLIYKTGMVTQSGPRPDLMKEVYDEINAFIREHKDMIESYNPEERTKKLTVKKYKKHIQPTKDLLLKQEIIVNPTNIYRNYLNEYNQNETLELETYE